MKEIEKIISAYERTDWPTERAALGTVVKVEESAYRRIGARMYVSSRGYWTGGISGGCLEGDALKRAHQAINKNESTIVVYDTLDEDDHQIGVGLGCNGRIEVLFTPIDPADPGNPIEFLKTIRDTRQYEILVQILQPGPALAHLQGLFYPMDQLQSLAKETGLQLTEIGQCIDGCRVKNKSNAFQLENSHGDQLEILVELIRPKVKLICIGDNYDVNAFAAIAHELGWELHVAGKKRKFGKEIFRWAKSVVSYERVKDIPVDDHTAVVLMSHDYRTDFELLQLYLKKDLPYIGLLGPRKRMEKMQGEMSQSGMRVDLVKKENLFAPVGLDLGAESPEEIALSIAAEIVATLRGRNAQRLREREGPIHER